MSYKIARSVWLPDLPDQRDHFYAAPVELAGVLPAKVNLRPQCPPVYDQGQLGSCTANAIAAAIKFDRLEQKLADFTPSRLFIYYNEHAIEHTIDSDSSAQIRNGIKSVGKQGDCPETERPYVIARFKTGPKPQGYANALKYRAIFYQRLTPILSQLKGYLASGYPFVFGFTVYESFESAQDGPARSRVAAQIRRASHWRPCHCRRWLRRCPAVARRPQLLGRQMGHEGLFYLALHVCDRRQSSQRLLDNPCGSMIIKLT
jgi:hypothetical protein